MPITKKNLNPQDLVLDLNEKVKNLNISKYEDFLFELCGDWEFQKEAIRNSIRFFIANQYKDTKELFEENYDKSMLMQGFADKSTFLKEIPFPYKKSCTIDLATGTGKSWVIYGVARILLAEGIVDQVLVLCPSKTIKYELHKKFSVFTESSVLTDALPKKSVIKVPGLKHSDQTIEKGDICIDNVHKTYDHVSSSINDSLERKGARTLVVNDEAHHILNPKGSGESTKMLEWRKFLEDERYGFKYILNLSGTPYKGDSYFNDVIYRYSIRDAINNRFVKDIDYLDKDQSRTQEEKWKAILDNHEDLKKVYPKAKKHITIIVTKSISETDKIAQKIKTFLGKYTKLSDEEIEKKVIAVTSSPRHDENREILKRVDSASNPVEWIVSVSMLTEGWDVSNIFQIVPHEARAFNSKLLISQVLGRGLRIPDEYRNSEILPKVRIFNHTAWSQKIDRLVMEVAEITSILKNNVLKKSKYNFDLHKINIDKRIETKKSVKKVSKISLPKTLGFSSTNKTREQTYTNVKTHRKYLRETDVSKLVKKYSVEEATNGIYTNIYLFDMSKGSDITSKVSKEYIRGLIKKELKLIGEDFVSEENLQLGKLAFNGLFRQFVGFTKIEDIYGDVEIINTSSINSIMVSESSFKNNGGLVTSKDNLKNLDKKELEIINKVKKEIKETKQTTLTDQTYIQARIIDDLDPKEYKCPVDITLISYRPEREFLERFVRNYSKYIDAWIKSPDQGFYEIPYIHRPGTHSLQKNFNPDFLIKKGNKIIVVEIKFDDDSTIKNKDKLEGAISYFRKLNEKLNEEFIYEFHFLDPRDYNTFFEKVLVKGENFKSQLHATLESKSREELKEGR